MKILLFDYNIKCLSTGPCLIIPIIAIFNMHAISITTVYIFKMWFSTELWVYILFLNTYESKMLSVHYQELKILISIYSLCVCVCELNRKEFELNPQVIQFSPTFC